MAEIVYVDEQQSQAHEVVRSAVKSGFFAKEDVVAVRPDPTLVETIESILPYRCKALIADYRLSEHMAEVEFTGVDLVREYQRRFYAIPCFVATAFADEAVQESIDTNIVFPKSDFLRPSDSNDASNPQLPFFMRVRRKIEEYTSFVESTVAEFKDLAAANAEGKLSGTETERLIELDGIVERLRGQDLSLPSHLKRQPLTTFSELVERAESLIQRIEAEIEDES